MRMHFAWNCDFDQGLQPPIVWEFASFLVESLITGADFSAGREALRLLCYGFLLLPRGESVASIGDLWRVMADLC